jgi:thioredoxin
MKRQYLLLAAAVLLFNGSCSSSSAEEKNSNSSGHSEIIGTSTKSTGTSENSGSDVSGSSDASMGSAGTSGSGASRILAGTSGSTGRHGTKMLTKADFLARVMNYEKNQEEWVFEGDKPCLIDFYADWCAPCRITSPILEELAVEYGDKIDIYKVDTQKERELAAVFGIQSLPSFLFVPMEGKPTMSSGIARTPEETKAMFREQINTILLQ